MSELKFTALTMQERISRLEELVSKLSELVRQLSISNSFTTSGLSTITGKVATDFRDCDGEPYIYNSASQIRALFDEYFAMVQGLGLITRYIDSTRIGAFGLDDEGKFFALKNDSQGERLVLLASDSGFWIRDQNGRFGKLTVDAFGKVIFSPA